MEVVKGGAVCVYLIDDNVFLRRGAAGFYVCQGLMDSCRAVELSGAVVVSMVGLARLMPISLS
jgi:hypothetical protein